METQILFPQVITDVPTISSTTNKKVYNKNPFKNTKCLREIIKENKQESLKIRHYILLYGSTDKIGADFKSVE